MSRDWEKDLEFIRGLTPPPAEPFGTPVDWGRFEAENGFSPPSDFRALVDVYGAGDFKSGLGELEIPQLIHPDRTFVESVQREIDWLLGGQMQFPESSPRWPAFPAPGGFLPLGGTGIGWTVGWLTRGSPDEWWLAVNGNRDGWSDQLPIGIVQFARRWLTGDLGMAEVDPFEPGKVGYEPQREDADWHGRTCEVKVEFAPTLEAGRFWLQWAEGDPWPLPAGREFAPLMPIEQLSAEISPGRVLAYASFGDRGVAEQASVSLDYRPDEEPLVIEAIDRLASRLGTTIASVTASDGTPGWPARRTRNPD